MRKKRRVRQMIVLLLVAVVVILVLLRICAGPAIQSLATSSVSNRASAVINDAIEAQIADNEIDYDSIILLEKDVNGKVSAIRTNIAEINRIKTHILTVIDRMLLDLDVSEVGIPLGNLILPVLFSGMGTRIPVRIVSVSNSEAEFRNLFSEAGINQTSHQIMLDVTITMTVLTPIGTQSVEAMSAVVVAETIIVGNVPNSYVDYH